MRAALAPGGALLALLLGAIWGAPATAASPCVAVGTWNFAGLAVDRAGEVLARGGSAIDAAEAGVNALELDTSEQTYVGYGGLPNAEGDMEFDAAIMDGRMCRYGAVLALQGVKRAVSVARLVMEKSVHNVLAGAGALKFAISNGMAKEDTLTHEAKREWAEWLLTQPAPEPSPVTFTTPKRSLSQQQRDRLGQDPAHEGIPKRSLSQQQRDRQGLASAHEGVPDSKLPIGVLARELSTGGGARDLRYPASSGARGDDARYSPGPRGRQRPTPVKTPLKASLASPRHNATAAARAPGGRGARDGWGDEGRGGWGGDVESHDTIGLICLDGNGDICAATSTSGWKFKHPGRVGDAPLIGAGLYADNSVGAAVATGDGEDIMRACVASVVVERMRQGDSPAQACRYAIRRVRQITLPDQEGGKDGDKQHRKLTVGVVALSKSGQVGASSTLGPHNEHRGRPAFPAEVWRQDSGRQTIFAAEERPRRLRFWRAVSLGAFWGMLANLCSFLVLRLGIVEWGRLNDATPP